MPIIPKRLNAIWLGGILNEEGRSNIQNWRKVNPDYEIRLWVDTGLYPQSVLQDEFEHLKAWAREHNIIISDISHNQNSNYVADENRADLLDQSPLAPFYNDEIIGRYLNYASASDLLRIEILNEGGIYFDVKDVAPNEPLGDLEAPLGFLYNFQRKGKLNNDLLASVPQGEMITRYRNEAIKQYQDLYADEKKLRAHRNAAFTSPFYYQGSQARIRSTLELTGPLALTKVLNDFCEEHQLTDETESLLHFNNAYYDAPEKTALSWVGGSLTSYDDLSPIFRNYVREFFSLTIEKMILNADAADVFELNKLKTRIEALPTSITLVEILKAIRRETVNSEIISNHSGNGLLEQFEGIAASAENLLQFSMNNIPADVFREVLKIGLLEVAPEKFNLEGFVNQVLNTKEKQPNISKFQLFLPKEVPDPETESYENKLASR